MHIDHLIIYQKMNAITKHLINIDIVLNTWYLSN